MKAIKGKSDQMTEYEYNDMGMMATIGKHKAVVELPFVKFKGPIAWYVWMFLHLMLILSVRNKLVIFFNWAWSYLTKDTSLRIITNVITSYSIHYTKLYELKYMFPTKILIIVVFTPLLNHTFI